MGNKRPIEEPIGGRAIPPQSPPQNCSVVYYFFGLYSQHEVPVIAKKENGCSEPGLEWFFVVITADYI